MTLMNGRPLPFVAAAVPAGTLPIQVLGRIGAKRWTVLTTKY
jgi:hypothetical protein